MNSSQLSFYSARSQQKPSNDAQNVEEVLMCQKWQEPPSRCADQTALAHVHFPTLIHQQDLRIGLL